MRVARQQITDFTRDGCRCDDGEQFSFDVLICATGFDTSCTPRFSIIGLDDLNLQDLWSLKPRSYLGIAASGFPNLFFVLGPHSPIGNGPLHPALGSRSSENL